MYVCLCSLLSFHAVGFTDQGVGPRGRKRSLARGSAAAQPAPHRSEALRGRTRQGPRRLELVIRPGLDGGSSRA